MSQIQWCPEHKKLEAGSGLASGGRRQGAHRGLRRGGGGMKGFPAQLGQVVWQSVAKVCRGTETSDAPGWRGADGPEYREYAGS